MLTWEEECGQAESESPPASSGARKPHPSHRGPGVRREGPRGERSPRSRNQSGRRRPIAAGRRALQGSRSAAAVGRGGVGWVRSARPQSGPRAAGGSEARWMPAASCTSHAPFSSSALLPAPVPALFFHAERGWGEGPTPGAPGCPAARRGLPTPGALTPSRSAPTCRRPWPAVLRGRRAGGRRGGLGAQAAGGRARGSAAVVVRLRARRGQPGTPRVPLHPPRAAAAAASACAAWSRRSATMCSCPGADSRRARRSRSFSHSPSASLSAALAVMSDRGGGASVNPLLAPVAPPAPARPWPGPARPDRAPLPAPGGGGSPARAAGVCRGPLAREAPLRPPSRLRRARGLAALLFADKGRQ